MPASSALEADIRQRVEELETLFDGIVSCRVTVEMPHRSHHQGQHFRARIELGVPGERLVAGRSPDLDASHEDAHIAVHDAFRAAKRQLGDYVRLLRA